MSVFIVVATETLASRVLSYWAHPLAPRWLYTGNGLHPSASVLQTHTHIVISPIRVWLNLIDLCHEHYGYAASTD